MVFHRLVEEFMLLANMAVAHKTYKTYPKKALLRRHPPPKSKMMEDLVSFSIKKAKFRLLKIYSIYKEIREKWQTSFDSNPGSQSF